MYKPFTSFTNANGIVLQAVLKEDVLLPKSNNKYLPIIESLLQGLLEQFDEHIIVSSWVRAFGPHADGRSIDIAGYISKDLDPLTQSSHNRIGDDVQIAQNILIAMSETDKQDQILYSQIIYPQGCYDIRLKTISESDQESNLITCSVGTNGFTAKWVKDLILSHQDHIHITIRR